MTATQMDPFIYCIATSSQIQSSGYRQIYIESFRSNFDGLLDPYVLTQLTEVTDSLQTLYFYDMLALSEDEQWQLISFSTDVMNKSRELERLVIYQISALDSYKT